MFTFVASGAAGSKPTGGLSAPGDSHSIDHLAVDFVRASAGNGPLDAVGGAGSERPGLLDLESLGSPR